MILRDIISTTIIRNIVQVSTTIHRFIHFFPNESYYFTINTVKKRVTEMYKVPNLQFCSACSSGVTFPPKYP